MVLSRRLRLLPISTIAFLCSSGLRYYSQQQDTSTQTAHQNSANSPFYLSRTPYKGTALAYSSPAYKDDETNQLRQLRGLLYNEPVSQLARDTESTAIVVDTTQHTVATEQLATSEETVDECAGEHENISPVCEPGKFVFSLVILLSLVCAAGLMAGLTMGLVSMDKLNLSILQLEGDDRAKEAARKILPVLTDHHLLLTTLLLWNSFANEALPMVLDRLVDPASAVILSMTLVLIFGEIIPSAIFTGSNQLYVAASFVPVVRVLLTLTLPLSFPIKTVLDIVLGKEQDITRYKRSELKALVELQRVMLEDMKNMLSEQESAAGPNAMPSPSEDSENAEKISVYRSATMEDEELQSDEVKVIHGALEMACKTVVDAMIPWDQVFTLNTEQILNMDVMSEILSTGHGRIPVYDERKENIRGMLMTKQLIVVDPNEGKKVQELTIIQPLLAHPQEGLYRLLTRFEKGKCGFALVTKHVGYVQECWENQVPVDELVTFEGIITVNDILQLLIQRELANDMEDLSNDICQEFVEKHKGYRAITPLDIFATVAKAAVRFKSLGRRRRSRTRKLQSQPSAASTSGLPPLNPTALDPSSLNSVTAFASNKSTSAIRSEWTTTQLTYGDRSSLSGSMSYAAGFMRTAPGTRLPGVSNIPPQAVKETLERHLHESLNVNMGGPAIGGSASNHVQAATAPSIASSAGATIGGSTGGGQAGPGHPTLNTMSSSVSGNSTLRAKEKALASLTKEDREKLHLATLAQAAAARESNEFTGTIRASYRTGADAFHPQTRTTSATGESVQRSISNRSLARADSHTTSLSLDHAFSPEYYDHAKVSIATNLAQHEITRQQRQSVTKAVPVEPFQESEPSPDRGDRAKLLQKSSSSESSSA